MKKLLGFYKSRIKDFFIQSYIRLKLRLKGHKIGKGAAFYSAELNGICEIRDHATIGPKVVLAGNNIIGSNAKLSNISIGENTHVEGGVICTGYGNGAILIGKESYIGINNVIDWSDNITIGDFVQIAGPSTALWTHTGASMCINGVPLSNKSKHFRPTAPIQIESNVYIGCNCTIYPGITIRHHSIIAPNSAVTKDVPPFTMVGGVPARKIKEIKPVI
jgi:acetyltransferase-like isoleucine patch superfamily enzyme